MKRKMIEKWAENGPRMATVNNPNIDLQDQLF